MPRCACRTCCLTDQGLLNSIFYFVNLRVVAAQLCENDVFLCVTQLSPDLLFHVTVWHDNKLWMPWIVCFMLNRIKKNRSKRVRSSVLSSTCSVCAFVTDGLYWSLHSSSFYHRMSFDKNKFCRRCGERTCIDRVVILKASYSNGKQCFQTTRKLPECVLTEV